MEEEDLDYLLKVVVIGDSGVGKTNLIQRFSQGKSNPQSRPTIGVDFSSKTLKVKDLNVKAQFWDTAGQEKYRSMTTSYYKGSAGGVLVYDITQRSTFASVMNWLTDFREFTDAKIGAILIGNKKDLSEQRQVTVEEAQSLAQKEGLFFMETSAVEAEGGRVEEAFLTLLESIVGTKETELDEAVPAGKTLQGTSVGLKPKEDSKCCQSLVFLTAVCFETGS